MIGSSSGQGSGSSFIIMDDLGDLKIRTSWSQNIGYKNSSELRTKFLNFLLPKSSSQTIYNHTINSSITVISNNDWITVVFKDHWNNFDELVEDIQIIANFADDNKIEWSGSASLFRFEDFLGRGLISIDKEENRIDFVFADTYNASLQKFSYNLVTNKYKL